MINKIINIKNLLLYLILLTNTVLFAPINHYIDPHANNTITTTPPQNPVATEYIPPAPRNIVVILDGGQENIYKDLFVKNPTNQTSTNNPLTLDFLSALTATTKTPIFVSESIMNNLVARQVITNDFKTLSHQELINKYGNTNLFGSEEFIAAFQNITKVIDDDISKIQTSFNEFVASPTEITLKNTIKRINEYSSDMKELITSTSQALFNKDTNKATNFVRNIISDFLPYQNGLDLTKWKIGKTQDGSYMLLPLNENGVIQSTGLQYEHLDGFNGTTTIPNPIDLFNANMKTATENTHTDVNAGARSLLDIIKIETATPTTNPNLITFDPEEHAKLNIFLTGHGLPEKSDSNGVIAGIDQKVFTEELLPDFNKAYIQSFTIESCYASADNLDKAFDINKKIARDPLSFTLTSGLSTYTPAIMLKSNIIYSISDIIIEQANLYKSYKPLSTTQDLEQKVIDSRNKFDNYFNLTNTNIAEAITKIFNNRDQNDVTGITSSPSMLLAGTTTWQTVDYVRTNIMQISNIKNVTKTVNNEAFDYNLLKGGGILLSDTAITTPINIKLGSELPFLVPLSTDEQIHYIKEIIIEDPSISIETFIEKSIKPFIDQMNIVRTDIGQKTIVIDSLHVKEGIITLIVTNDYAIYTINDSLANTSISKKLHTIKLTNRDFTWKSISKFNELLKKGRDNATSEMLKVEQIQGISMAIHKRQESLLLIQKLTAGVDWEIYSRDHVLTNKDAVYQAIIEGIKQIDNKQLSLDFLMNLSSHQLQIICDSIKNYSSTDIELNDDIKTALADTSKNASLEMNRKILQDELTYHLSKNDQAALDWYMTLSLNDQILIKYEFNAAFEDGTILSQDPDTLTNKERLFLKDYLEATLSIVTAPTQIADLKQKLNAIETPRNEDKFNDYLRNKLKTLSSPDLRIELIDWITSLDESEKNGINLDIEAIFVQETLADIWSPSVTLPENVTELFEYKLTLEEFLLGTDQTKNAILDKAYILGTSHSISSSVVQSGIANTIDSINTAIIEEFKYLNDDEQLTLLYENSVDNYAKIFKKLSFEMQTTIAQNLNSLKGAITTDLLNYQKSLLPERIAAAATPDDLDAIQADLTAAMSLSQLTYSPTDMPAIFQTTYNKLLAEQNKRIAEHAPAIPNAGSTGTLSFDPATINEKTDQPFAPDSNQGNPTDPTNPNNTTGQVIQNKNPDFKDKELEDEWKKKQEQEIAQEKQAKDIEAANKEAEKNNNPERIIK